VAEFEDRVGDADCCGESVDGILGSVVSSTAVAEMTSSGWTRFTNGMRTYWLGAAGFLNIGLGRGRDGDGDPDANVDPDALGLGLLLAIRAAVSRGEDGDGDEGG